jgi:hypothetical protein
MFDKLNQVLEKEGVEMCVNGIEIGQVRVQGGIL